MEKCEKECEVFSRVVGYFRPVRRWNEGKTEEFRERVTFDVKKETETNGNGCCQETPKAIPVQHHS